MNPDYYYSFVMDPWSKLYICIRNTGRVSYLLGNNFIIPSSSSRRRGHRQVVSSRDPGISYLRNFIKKSLVGSSSSSSTITSLCLGPFRFSYWDNEYEWVDHDEILYLIAHCCPNLKHISFDGFYSASIEAVLQVFQRCKKIELIDFSDSGYADSVQVIKELGNCLPNLRGIRMAGWKKVIHDAIATHFPWIKLNCEKRECYYRCVECDYAYFSPVLVRESLCRRLVHVNRPRFQHRYRRLCNQCWPSVVEEEEAFQEKVEALVAKYEAESEYYRDLEEDQQYVRVVLRTRMRKKNMKHLEAASSFLMKMEMKMRKKTDTYDCQDFYDRE